MGEQLKKQTLFNLLESNSKNLFWVDKYVSGPEGEGGTYQTRRMTQEQFLQLIESNINFNTGIKTFKNITGYPIEKGSLCAIDSPNGGIITAVPINSSEEALSHIYVATTTIANGTSGTFIEEGMITGIDTTSFTIGDFIYWHPSTKTISNTPESDKLFLGIVITTALLGDIYVSPTQNYSVVSGNSGQVALFIGLNHIESNSRFTFVDNVGTEVGFRFDDGNGNLTQVGCTYLNVESQGTASNSVLRLANWSDINTNTVVMRKARGTKSSPSGVLVNDILGRWLGTGQTDDGGGSTTFEMEVIAKDDYVRNGWAMYPEVYRMALTAFRIKLASSYDSGYLDISSIQNPIVFELDGDGNIKFKNFRLPATDGAPGQILKTDGAGNIIWADEGSLGYTAENVINKAVDFVTKNNILYPTTLAVYNEIVAQITALVNSSPATLDTLNELATALGNDPNFATSMATALGLRELLSNKDTDPTLSGNSDIKYPSQKAVKTYIDNILVNPTSSFIPNVKGNEVFRGLTFRLNSASYDTYASLGISNSASISALSLNSSVFGKKFIRALYYASIVQTGRYTGVRGTSEIFFIGTGFRFETMFRVADTVYSAGCQMFFGLAAGTVDLPFGGSSLIQLDTLLNLIGVGCNGTDTNLNIYYNDGLGNCSKIDLGINFPANRTSSNEMTTMYAIQIYNSVGSTNVKIEVKNLETGNVAQHTLSNDLPSINQGLNIFACRTMNSPMTNTGQFELAKWGCSSI